MALVADPNHIRLAMLGMVDGNGHPYSWSAIINGDYNRDLMAKSPYAGISQYLNAQAPEALGITGAKVTHVWCDDPLDTARVAAASLIPNRVERAEDVIGEVDAVIIATDKPEEHLDRALPFIESGLPVFIDKPLTNQPDHLGQFIRWHEDGKPFLSSSCMRYAVEYVDARHRLADVGDLRLLTMTMCKSWERYGIHALEGVYPLLAPGGWISATHNGDASRNIVHLQHASGVDIVISVIADLYGSFGCLGAFGTKGHLQATIKDTFYAFKTQLTAMIHWLQTGHSPVAFAETVELMKLIIAVQQSLAGGGRTVMIDDILSECVIR